MRSSLPGEPLPCLYIRGCSYRILYGTGSLFIGAFFRAERTRNCRCPDTCNDAKKPSWAGPDERNILAALQMPTPPYRKTPRKVQNVFLEASMANPLSNSDSRRSLTASRMFLSSRYVFACELLTPRPPDQPPPHSGHHSHMIRTNCHWPAQPEQRLCLRSRPLHLRHCRRPQGRPEGQRLCYCCPHL